MRAARTVRGFTLLELIVATTILLLLAGAAMPVVSSTLSVARADATRARIADLRRAAESYARDTLLLPSAILDLRADPGVAGWRGPYTSSQFEGSLDAPFGQDAYGNGILWTLSQGASIGTLRSPGEDRRRGTADDIVARVALIPIRRDVTLVRIARIDAALAAYAAEKLPAEPLPTAWPAALTKLRALGLLDSDPAYERDAWGAPFQAAGGSPLVRVRSASLAAQPTSEAPF